MSHEPPEIAPESAVSATNTPMAMTASRHAAALLLLAAGGLSALDAAPADAAARSNPRATVVTGTMDGHAWTPRIALAGRDDFGGLVIDLLPEAGGCNDISFA